MFSKQVPKPYWREAALTTTFLFNRLPACVLGKTSPIELLTMSSSIFPIPPKVPDCVSFVHNHYPTHKNLDPRALKCVFVSYSPTQKGYK